MTKGFLYLVVIMDWVSRAVLAWRVSNTLGADFCVEALAEALLRYGRPEIFNTDQGSQFTSESSLGQKTVRYAGADQARGRYAAIAVLLIVVRGLAPNGEPLTGKRKIKSRSFCGTRRRAGLRSFSPNPSSPSRRATSTSSISA
jgi:hypothetical protein